MVSNKTSPLYRAVLCAGILGFATLMVYQEGKTERVRKGPGELTHNTLAINWLWARVPAEAALTRLSVEERLSQSTRHSGLHPELRGPDKGTDYVSMGADSFGKLVSWLAELEVRYDIQVDQLQFQPERESEVEGGQVVVKNLVLKHTVTG